MLGKVSLHEGLSRGKGVGEGALGTPIPAGVSPEPWTGGPGSCWGSTRVGRRQDSRGSGKGAKAQGPRAAHRPPPQGLSLHQGRGLVPHSYLLTRRCGSSGLHPTEEKPSHPLSYHLHSRQVCCGQSGEGTGGRMRAGPAWGGGPMLGQGPAQGAEPGQKSRKVGPSLFFCRRKWQPTPVFLPGESYGGGAWSAAVHGVAKSRTRLSDFAFTSFPLFCADSG